MSTNEVVLEESNIPIHWHLKVNDFFKDIKVPFTKISNKYVVKLKNQEEFSKVNTLFIALKEKPYFEALTYFPSLDVEDFFLIDYRLPFIDLIPFLEDYSKKGIEFDFGDHPGDSCWVVDANECLKLIPQSEHQKLLDFENRLGTLLPKASESNLTKTWFLNIGVNYLSKIYINQEPNLTDSIEHILDFLNAFSREESIVQGEVEIDPRNRERLIALNKEKESLIKSSYAENLAKAPAFFIRLSKRLSKEEDWDGLEEVFKYQDYTIYQLLSEKNKDRESSIMQHCVGNGGYDLSSGIYSLREKSNLPLATIEVDENGRIVQIQGITNKQVNSKAMPALKAFIENYLKIDPSEISLDINIGWVKVKLMYPEFGKETYQEIYIGSDEISGELSNQNYMFFIHFFNWKEQLESQFNSKNISQGIRSRVVDYLLLNPPFTLKEKILGFKFVKTLKIPNINRFKLIEELATLVHSHLDLFDDASAYVIRQVNYKFNAVKFPQEATELLNQIDTYFKKGLNTKRWSTLNQESILKSLTSEPVKTFNFYRQYLRLLKKLNPEALITFEPSFWLEVFGSIFPDNLLDQPFLKIIDSLSETAELIDQRENIKSQEIDKIVYYSKFLNPTQNAILKKHLKNLKKEIKDFNLEMKVFVSQNEGFIDFFSHFDLRALDSFDLFILEDKVDITKTKQFWLLNQQVKFVKFHISKFQFLLNSPSFLNISEHLNKTKDILSKITLLLSFCQLGAEDSEVDTKDSIDVLTKEVQLNQEFIEKIEQLIKPTSSFNIIARTPSDVIVIEILENWQESIKNSRVTQR